MRATIYLLLAIVFLAAARGGVCQELQDQNALGVSKVIPFREAPVVVVPQIKNNLPGGLIEIKYGTEVIVKPIQSITAITDTFVSRLNETRRLRVLERDRLAELNYEMFANDEALDSALAADNELFLADYAFLASIATVDVEVRRSQTGGFWIEKLVINVHVDLRIVDLHPERNWGLVDSTNQVPVTVMFASQQEAAAARDRLAAEHPASEFALLAPTGRKPGEIVWGMHTDYRYNEGYLVQAGNVHHKEIDLAREELILDAMVLALETAVLELMEPRWPLRITEVSSSGAGGQLATLNRGGWMISRSSQRAGIPQLRVGKLTDKQRVPQPPLFGVYREGALVKDPDTGIILGRRLGEEIALLRVSTNDRVKAAFSEADVISGHVSAADLGSVMLRPISIDRIRDDVQRQGLSRLVDMRNYVMDHYGVYLHIGWFRDLPRAPKTRRSRRTRGGQ